MNLRESRVVLRVRATTDVLDLAAPFCRVNWRLFVPLLVVLAPGLGACLVARHVLDWPWGAVWTLAVVLAGLSHAPFTVACGEVLFTDPRNVRLGTIGSRVLRRLPAFLTVHLVSRLLSLMATVSLVLIPYATWVLFVVHEAVLLEGSGPFAAIARSGRAVRGQGASVFGIACAVLLLPVAGAVGGDLVGSTLVEDVFQMGRPFGSLWTDGGSVYALAGFFLTVPLSAAAKFLKYLDLRTRKEGWDIQLQFMAVAAAKPARAAAAENPEAA